MLSDLHTYQHAYTMNELGVNRPLVLHYIHIEHTSLLKSPLSTFPSSKICLHTVLGALDFSIYQFRQIRGAPPRCLTFLTLHSHTHLRDELGILGPPIVHHARRHKAGQKSVHTTKARVTYAWSTNSVMCRVGQNRTYILHICMCACMCLCV